MPEIALVRFGRACLEHFGEIASFGNLEVGVDQIGRAADIGDDQSSDRFGRAGSEEMLDFGAVKVTVISARTNSPPPPRPWNIDRDHLRA